MQGDSLTQSQQIISFRVSRALSQMIAIGDSHVTVYKLSKMTGINSGNLLKFFKKIKE